ncbi:MAG TPA: NAD(P)-binding domain-containing protein [Acidobacteriota bacterium]|nr:NAD(P)-binding domain-containing protein [Acidobacteriota bacterium]
MAHESVAVLGSGTVGEALANGFLKHGYKVMRASRDPNKVADWKSRSGANASVGTFQEAAAFGDVVVLAVKGTAAESAISLCGPGNLRGKTVIDATNPIADEAPVNGVLKFFTDINFSLMERLQKLAPEVHFVKAFSCVGKALMVNPNLSGGRPTMFICGNHAGAKGAVKEILTRFGWETEDMGAAEAARAIEPLCMLWCIPGLTRNDWVHAFKLLRG